MKISSSSSMLLASLAFSASSPSLAAPTNDVPNYPSSGLSASISRRDLETAVSNREVAAPFSERQLTAMLELDLPSADEEQRQMYKRGLGELLCGIPILGEVACGLVKTGCGLLGAEAMESTNDGDSISYDKMAEMRAAVLIASSAIAEKMGTPTPANVAGPMTTAPSALLPTGSSSILAAPTPSTTPVLIASEGEAPVYPDDVAGQNMNAQDIVSASVAVSMTLSGLGVASAPTAVPSLPAGVPVKPPTAVPSLPAGVPVKPPTVPAGIPAKAPLPSPPAGAPLPVSPGDVPGMLPVGN